MGKRSFFTKPVATLITAEAHQKMMDICDNREISISEWVRKAIDAKLEEDENDIHNPELNGGNYNAN